jgi:hypothetical protein
MEDSITIQNGEDQFHILDFDWDWALNAGYSGKYKSAAMDLAGMEDYWQFDYTLRAFGDFQTSLTTTLIGFYKATFHLSFDLFDVTLLK